METSVAETGGKVIVFRLGEEDYGVDVQQVDSIERMQPITRVANVPDFVQGVINLRGVVTPVIDLRSKFGMPQKEHDESTRIVIVHTENVQVGLIVDSAHDVMDIPAGVVEEPPSGLGEVDVRYLEGVAKLEDRLLVLLNLDRVLSREDVREIQKED